MQICLFIVGGLPVFSHAANLEQPDQRYLLFMREQTVGLSEGVPENVGLETLTEVAQHFPPFDPAAEILVGVGGIFSYLRYDITKVEQSLRNFLAASEEASVPVWIKLDWEQWWDARPDLWNWWDPRQPGYDPENAKNVEWTWWSPAYATRIAWRNWGRQLRVKPNAIATFVFAAHSSLECGSLWSAVPWNRFGLGGLPPFASRQASKMESGGRPPALP